MARMFPATIKNRKSPAEVRLFGDLERLPDGWIALYQVRWLAKERGRNARDGETDFLVAHPRHGALTVEVKGGEITFVAKTGEWTSRSRDGTTSSIKDPFDQAKQASYALMDHLRSLPH